MPAGRPASGRGLASQPPASALECNQALRALPGHVRPPGWKARRVQGGLPCGRRYCLTGIVESPQWSHRPAVPTRLPPRTLLLWLCSRAGRVRGLSGLPAPPRLPAPSTVRSCPSPPTAPLQSQVCLRLRCRRTPRRPRPPERGLSLHTLPLEELSAARTVVATLHGCRSVAPRVTCWTEGWVRVGELGVPHTAQNGL